LKSYQQLHTIFMQRGLWILFLLMYLLPALNT
jgi:hypothetical protein